jgi:hypothetical protein
MQSYLKKVLITIFLFTHSLLASASLLLDRGNVYQLPKSFRTTAAIQNLKLMGSGQFSEKNLLYIIEHHSKPTYLFDLRQESHGFLNGNAVSWYGKNNWDNLDKNLIQIMQIENSLLKGLIPSQDTLVFTVKPNKNPIEIKPYKVENEQQLASKYHINYIRIPVPDHRRPNDDQVEQFVQIISRIPQDKWLYFHCKGGKGRTTSFMAMVDMIYNAKNKTFEEILTRQQQLGGANLLYLDPSKPLNNYAAERLAFLNTFYQYCVQNKDGFKTGWKEWLKGRHPMPANH